MSNFESTLRKGFCMTFENGLTVSVQWGAGNYCDNQFTGDFSCKEDEKSTTAEVAVWNAAEVWANASDFLGTSKVEFDPMVMGEPAGWLSANEVAQLIANVAKWEG
jgi:hypothetical protein